MAFSTPSLAHHHRRAQCYAALQLGRRLLSSVGGDPWRILGVAPGADDATVKKAYRAKAMKHHPDRGGDPEAFKQISAAYDACRGDGGGGNRFGGAQGNPFGGAHGHPFGGGNPFGGAQRGQQFSNADAEKIFRDAFGDDTLLKDFQDAFTGGGTTTTTMTTNSRGETVMRSVTEVKKDDGTTTRTVSERVMSGGVQGNPFGGHSPFGESMQFQRTNVDGAKVGKVLRKMAGAAIKRAARRAVDRGLRNVTGAVTNALGKLFGGGRK